jgi:hypothetical protein
VGNCGCVAEEVANGYLGSNRGGGGGGVGAGCGVFVLVRARRGVSGIIGRIMHYRYFPLLLFVLCVSGCASKPPPASEASTEQIVRFIESFVALSEGDLVLFTRGFYRDNERWPNWAELQSFQGTRFKAKSYENLQIVENESGNCLLTYTNKRHGYEAKITIVRPSK